MINTETHFALAPRPAIDLEAAQRFLTSLDPTAKSHHITLLPDGPEHRHKPGLFWTGNASFSAASAMCCNRNEAGASVCVAVNATDGTGRKSENIVRIRAVFADWDDGLPADVPLEPSIINQTSAPKGQIHAQALWLISLDDTMDRVTFAGIEARLVADYGADPHAIDLARNLRLPGFLHQKDSAAPFLVRRIGGSQRRYTMTELVAAYPPLTRIDPPRPAPVVLEKRGADRLKRYAIGAVHRAAGNLATLEDGRRHAVFSAACSLGKFVAHDVIAQDEVEAALLAAWDASGAARQHGRTYAIGAIRRGIEKSKDDLLPVLDELLTRHDREA